MSMTPQYLHDYILPAALALLPSRMDSPEGRAMLIAIAMQESGLRHRRQIRGPARGLWQFETGSRSGPVLIMRHKATAVHLARAMAAISHPIPTSMTTSTIRVLFEHDTIACAVFARLLLWTLPMALPERDSPGTGWSQYLDAWRPGRPHPETWEQHWIAAWGVVAA